MSGPKTGLQPDSPSFNLPKVALQETGVVPNSPVRSQSTCEASLLSTMAPAFSYRQRTGDNRNKLT